MRKLWRFIEPAVYFGIMYGLVRVFEGAEHRKWREEEEQRELDEMGEY
jgi:hypothetical protein